MIRIDIIFSAIFCLNFWLLLTFIVENNPNNNWAVLVAGSQGYNNYRHQADVAHAYQILIKHGFNRRKIITMMYNDVVNSEENPVKGKLFNKPNGKDVYNGIIVDFPEDILNVENFIGVLNGTGESGKILNVTLNDRVFIFMSGNGAKGIFAFPTDILTADDLVGEIKKLALRSKGVAIFVDSSYSGSLFEGQIAWKDQKILAFTSSNSIEESFPNYWSDEFNTFLGDLFSVSWMELVENMDTKKTQFLKLLTDIKNLTNLSHVLHFGDQGMLNLNLNEFFRSKSEKSNSLGDNPKYNFNKVVSSHETQLYTMIKRCQSKPNKACLDKIKYLRESIKRVEKIFNKLKIEMEIFKTKNKAKRHNSPYPNHVYVCYKNSVKLFSKICSNYNKVEKIFSYLENFLNMCAIGMDEKRIAHLLQKNC